MVLFVVVFSALSLAEYRAHNMGWLDLGFYAQSMWNTLHGRFLEATFIDQNESIFKQTVQPILALIAPLFWVWSDPRVLLILQAVVVSLGALPIYWLATERLKSQFSGLVFAAAYLLFPSMQYATLFDFHAETLATSLLLYTLYFFQRQRWVWFALFLMLSLMSKEPVSLVVAAWVLIVSMARGEWGRAFLAILLLALLRDWRLCLIPALAAGGAFLAIKLGLLPNYLIYRALMTFGPEDMSWMAHSYFWGQAAELVRQNPSGYGLGSVTAISFAHLFPVGPRISPTESGFLQLALEMGIGGLGLYLWLLISVIGTGWRVQRNLKHDFLKWVAGGILAWAIAVSVGDIIQPSVASMAPLFWSLTGLVMRFPALDLGAKGGAEVKTTPEGIGEA